jgi:5-methylthioadenosine/S-adenosylhomocysteine deaminase
METEIGSLDIGKKADVIILDVDNPWCRPIRRQNLITNIVFNSNGGDVTDVFVDGRHVMQDRRVTRRSCRKPKREQRGSGRSLQTRGHEDEQK